MPDLQQVLMGMPQGGMQQGGMVPPGSAPMGQPQMPMAGGGPGGDPMMLIQQLSQKMGVNPELLMALVQGQMQGGGMPPQGGGGMPPMQR